MNKSFTFCVAFAAILACQSTAMAENTATRTSADDVITSASGKTVEYDKTFSGCNLYPEFSRFEDSKGKSKIVFGDNNEVFFQDILSVMPMGTYVKGVMEGDKINVTLPQVVSYSDEWGFVLEIDVNLAKMNGDTDMVAMEGENTVTFSVDAEGTISLDPLADDCGIALIQLPSNAWYGFMENKIEYVPVGGSAVEEIESAAKGIVSETYFDLSGKRVNSPESGLLVRRTVFSDGSVATQKVFVR